MSDLLRSALKLGRNQNIAREEYLVALGKKEPAAFAVHPASIELENISGDVEFHIQLAIAKDGYMEIEAFCPDDFLVLSRRVIPTDVFPAGGFDLSVAVKEEKLHRGKNFTAITFETVNQKIVVPVVIDMQVQVNLGGENPKETTLDLYDLYFAFRKGMMDSSDWAKQSLEVIGSVNGTDKQALFMTLLRAHLLVETDAYVEAANLLEYMSDMLVRLQDMDYLLISYFNYVKTIYERDRKQSAELLPRFHEVYQKHPQWQILWMLLQLDSKYEENPGLKLDEISAQVEAGCTSPILYLEALEVFREYPRFLSDASHFELQILYLGVKLDMLTSGVSARLSEIFRLMTEEDFAAHNMPLALRILKYLYAHFPTRDLLRVICRILISQDDRSAEAGKYYEIAVREYIEDLPNLYYYYIYTLAGGDYVPLPSRVLEYFAGEDSLLMEHRRYLYANIITNRTRAPEYYRAYEDVMLQYAQQQIMAGAMDRDLAVLYRDIIETGRMTQPFQLRLFEAISTKEIVCHNDRMMNVMVFHDELNIYQDIPLTEGRARIKVYSGSAVILFKDITGNIYANVDYERTDLLDSGKYIDLCVKGVPISDYMMLEDTMPLLRAYKEPAEILNYMTHKMSTSSFRVGYSKRLLNDTVLYFSRNLREQDVYDALLGFFKYDLAPETKGKLIEIMIGRNLFRDAYEKIREEGFTYVEPESLATLSSALAELVQYREDALLLDMCEQSFVKTPFDPRIYKYLVQNYDDKLEVLLELYRAGRAYQEPYENLPERILRRTIETGEDPDIIGQIFAKYYTEGQDAALKKSYMVYRARRYLYEEEEADTEVFKYIENDLLQREEFPAAVIVAYLKYMSDKDISGKNRIRMIEMQVKALAGRSIMLEEFKRYRKYFDLPSALSNSIIITRIGQNATITYDIVSGSRTLHKEEKMAEVFDDCYAKYITLFYGETVVYTVDGEDPKSVSYDDLEIVSDESRYSEIDHIIRMKETGNILELNLSAKGYFVKDKLMERLFL